MSATLSPPMFLQFQNPNNSGSPAVGFKLFTYQAGTSVKQSTWTDSTQAVQNANPLSLDGNGVAAGGASAAVWGDPSLTYKFVWAPANDTDPPSSPIRTIDNITFPVSLGFLQVLTNQPILASYARTAAEIAAGVTPTNYAYAPGDVRRYGAKGDGSTDDSAAIQVAFNVGTHGAFPIIFPAGYTFRFTSYLQIFSNTKVHVFGTLNPYNRASGFYCNGATNISIDGFGIGQIQDPAVVAAYSWNTGSNTAPAIHIRSSTNVTVHGLIISYVSQGILASNATSNYSTGTPFTLSQAICSAVLVEANNCQFCEKSGIAAYSTNYLTYSQNYVYRCGDGGMWMMSCNYSLIEGNIRISPTSVPADVATFGSNNQAHPTTWNDEQGIELESCSGVVISGNVVTDMWSYGIDIKNFCTDILIEGNMVVRCEQSSISTRQGETPNPCHKVSIIGNALYDAGYLQFNSSIGSGGAIRTSETYICDIQDNTIFAYQTVPAFYASGPSGYISAESGNPHHSKLVIRGNKIEFKSTFQSVETVNYTATTPSAIVVNGYYDAVSVCENNIFADVYASTDARFNSNPVISLTYLNWTGSFYYPTAAKIDGNIISCWGGAGIAVTGLTAMSDSGLSISNNTIGALGEPPFISVTSCNGAHICGNKLSQVTSGTPAPGILIQGVVGNLLSNGQVSDNHIVNGWNTGNGSVTYGVTINYCSSGNFRNNISSGHTQQPFQITNCTGSIDVGGCTGTPRSGAGTPVGSVTSYYLGEPYLNTSGPTWYHATASQATTWA